MFAETYGSRYTLKNAVRKGYNEMMHHSFVSQLSPEICSDIFNATTCSIWFSFRTSKEAYRVKLFCSVI